MANDCRMQQVLYSLQQYGLAVLPAAWLGPNILEAMRWENAAILDLAEARFCPEELNASKQVAESQGCVFQVAPEAHPGHPARQDPTLYFHLRSSWPCSPAVTEFLNSEALLDLLQAALGSTMVLLYNEQYIIKPPHSKGSGFQWHYDSQCCSAASGAKYAPYLSVWVAVDDITAENGCLVVKPGARAIGSTSTVCGTGSTGGTGSTCTGSTGSTLNEVQQHQLACSTAHPAAAAPPPRCRASCYVPPHLLEQGVQYAYVDCTNALLQCLEARNAAVSTACLPPPPAAAAAAAECTSSPPLGLLMPAGTAVLFWDDLWHCSGPNRSRFTRSAYMAQFSSRPLVWAHNQQLVGLAVPLKKQKGKEERE